MLYRLFVPSQAVGASLKYFDLWHPANSGVDLKLISLKPVVSGAVAVTGLVAVDLFLQRTTAIGTGGTAASAEGTSQTACTISGHDNTQGIQGGITARLTPSGGATAGAVLAFTSVYTEEANAGTYMQIDGMVRHGYTDVPGLTIQPGSGIAVIQGSVASVGNIGFNVIFDLKVK